MKTIKINNFCTLKCYYDYDVNKKYDIFCSVFVKLKNCYKNFDLYKNGLYYLLEPENQELFKKHNIKYRIYIDKSLEDFNNNELLNIIESMKSNDNFQIIEFECESEYKDIENDKYHRGIISFFLRLLPFFEFENVVNDVNYVFVMDIDFTDYKMKSRYMEFLVTLYDKYREKHIDFLFYNMKGYKPFWTRNMGNMYNKVIMGGFNFGKIKLNGNRLLHFFEKTKERNNSKDIYIKNFYHQYDEYVNMCNKLIENNDMENRKIKYQKKCISYDNDKQYLYGIDEFYLTYYFFIEILEKNMNNNITSKNMTINNINQIKDYEIYEYKRNPSCGGLCILLKLFLENFINSKSYIMVKTLEIYRDMLKNSLLILSQEHDKFLYDKLESIYKKYIEGMNENSELCRVCVGKYCELFLGHDYDNVTGKKKLWEYVYIYLGKIFFSDNNYVMGFTKNKMYVSAFFDNNVYYDDTNNLVRLTYTIKKSLLNNYYKDIENHIIRK